MILLWEAFGLCPRFQIVMLGRRQTIFSTPYFQFEERFDYIFVYMCWNTCDVLLWLPGNYHGKYRKFLMEKSCGNFIFRFLWLVGSN